MIEIGVVGAGQLGTRYLQGLAAVSSPVSIWVVDPAANSLTLARERWREAGGEFSCHRVRFLSSLDGLPAAVDLVVVSTSADIRAVVVEHLESSFRIRYWLLEKLLAQSFPQLQSISQRVQHASGCWVNMPRRSMNWHQKIGLHLRGRGPYRILRRGGLWGLACNSIHFIDLVEWWVGEELVRVDTTGLDPVWFESKRPGFHEVTGEITAHFSAGSTLRLTSARGVSTTEFEVETSDGEILHIDEAAGRAYSSNGVSIDGSLEMQSFITTRLVSSILNDGRCDLPTLRESMTTHAVFLEAMRLHWNRFRQSDDPVVPIT